MKKERGINIIFPIIIRLFGRISRGKGRLNFGEANQYLKNGGGEEYLVAGNFIHPWALITYF